MIIDNRIKIVALKDSKDEPVLFTPFTFLHFLGGIVGNLLSRKLNIPYIKGFILYFILHFLYEVKDFYFSYMDINVKNYWTDNSYENSVSDQTFSMIGFICGQYIPLNNFISILILYLILNVIFIKIQLG
jgi:hypothetical protein